jgi:hypothetical protein
MTTAVSLYNQAVRFAEEADIARIKRLPVDYKALYGKAAQLEKEAALQMKPEDTEPLNRVAMLRSAAALSYKAGNFAESEKLIALARANHPDAYEAAKLDEIEAAIVKTTGLAPQSNILTITGTFSGANADENEIKIRDLESRQVYAFIVPARIFRKVVKSYWQDVVLAVGKTSPNGVLTLEKISPAN